MTKKTLLSTLVLMALTPKLYAELIPSDNEQTFTTSDSSFACASEALNLIPLLGKGDNFPNFVVQDIERELQRQVKSARIENLVCNAKVRTTIYSKTITEGGKQKQIVSGIEISFPMTIRVIAANQTAELNIEQVYNAKNLDNENERKVEQTFKVLSQQQVR